VDAAPVWSVSCLFVARAHRKQHVSVELLRAATAFAAARGAAIVEGYPQDPKSSLPASFVWTGLLKAFLAAGFHEVPRWSPNRPIVRFECSQPV
jgi:GNAT superfamily N-acetyltransferase